MERIFNIAESIGTDVRTRSAADAIKKAIESDTPPTCLSFSGVAFMSRSFTDELCAILDTSPSLPVVGMNHTVKTMYDVVVRSRTTTRIRPTENSEIKVFANVKDFFAFMRKYV